MFIYVVALGFDVTNVKMDLCLFIEYSFNFTYDE